MKRAELLFGAALLILIGLGVAYYLRPKEGADQGQAPEAQLPATPIRPAEQTSEQLRASVGDLVRTVEKLGGTCGKLWEPKPDEAWFMVDLPAKTTDEDLKQLPRIEFACWLNLRGSQVTNTGLAALRSQPRLLTLDLSDTKITGDGLKELAESESLVDLRLGDTAVRDTDLEQLAGFKRLRSLHLNHTQITDEGLTRILRISNLRELNINFTNISRAGLDLLRRFENLDRLSLAGMEWLTTEDMVTIGKLYNLERLHIGFSPVTDEGLEHLKALRYLERLTLLRTQVTDDGVKKLQQALPGCKIHNGASVVKKSN
jgi:Leucine Rich repeat